MCGEFNGESMWNPVEGERNSGLKANTGVE